MKFQICIREVTKGLESYVINDHDTSHDEYCRIIRENFDYVRLRLLDLTPGIYEFKITVIDVTSNPSYT